MHQVMQQKKPNSSNCRLHFPFGKHLGIRAILIYCLQRLGVDNTVGYAGPPNEYRVYVGTSLEWNIHGSVKSRYTCDASIAIVRW